jgi:hypothetical protein
MPWPVVLGLSLIGVGLVLFFITAITMIFLSALDGSEEELD